MGRVDLELVGLLGKALTQDVTRRLRFVVHAAGWLHSMVLHGCPAIVTDVWFGFPLIQLLSLSPMATDDDFFYFHLGRRAQNGLSGCSVTVFLSWFLHHISYKLCWSSLPLDHHMSYDCGCGNARACSL